MVAIYPPVPTAKICIAVIAPTPLLMTGKVTKAAVLPAYRGTEAK